jgi:hypothetical protein
MLLTPKKSFRIIEREIKSKFVLVALPQVEGFKETG